MRESPGETRVCEREKVLGETVTTKTEEYYDEKTGERKVRTVEIVEKLIEKEVNQNQHGMVFASIQTPFLSMVLWSEPNRSLLSMIEACFCMDIMSYADLNSLIQKG